MNELFKNYPGYLCFLIPVFALQQAAYFLFEYQLEAEYRYALKDAFFSAEMLYDYKQPITGLLFILMGLLSERLPNVKKVMLYAVSFMLLGHVLIIFNQPEVSFIGGIIYISASCICLIKLILNTSILFPVANDYKDHSFVLPILGGSILSMIILFTTSSFSFERFEIGLFAVSILIYLVLLYLINSNKDLGYEIVEETPTEEELAILAKGKWVLIGGIFLNLLGLTTYINITFVADLGSSDNDLFGLIDSFSFNPILGPLLAFATAIGYLIYVLRQYPQSQQIDKIIFGLIVLCGLGGLDLLNGYMGIYFLEYFISTLPYLVILILISSPILSILTHLNFSKKASLWLGVLFGIPQILSYLINEMTSLVSLQVIAWGCLLFLIGTIVYLRENKNYIYTQLALDEPNQEIDEDPEEDPFDHLIDRSGSE